MHKDDNRYDNNKQSSVVTILGVYIPVTLGSYCGGPLQFAAYDI